MLVGRKNSTYIQRNFGWTGYCVLGSIGVPYHELSHLITAVIFRHKIREVQLFRPVQGRADGTLGYVDHSWNSKSIYQRIGNFFIGTAPMFFGAGLMFIVLRIAYPSVFVNVAEISEIPGSLVFAFRNMFMPENLFTVWTLIVLLITVFICPYMDMSWEDIKGSTSGAIALIIVAIILSFITMLMPPDMIAQVQSVMNTFISNYAYALILGLIVSIIMVVLLGILLLIRSKGL